MEYELNHTLEVMFIVGHTGLHRNSWPESQLPILLTMTQVTLDLMSPSHRLHKDRRIMVCKSSSQVITSHLYPVTIIL
jgi:hypothetical protein